MQYPFSCVPATLDRIEQTISPARLGRFLPEAKGDRHLALRLYVWNARLCEAMYLPIQFAEVAARNAISIPIRKRFGTDWYINSKFWNILPERMKGELDDSIDKETKKRGAALDENHIIAGLSFGFWVGLMASAYENHLWAVGVRQSFPGADRHTDRAKIHIHLDELRRFRNDVVHHYAIFDRRPRKQFEHALFVTRLVCEETEWFSSAIAHFDRVLGEKPRP